MANADEIYSGLKLTQEDRDNLENLKEQIKERIKLAQDDIREKMQAIDTLINSLKNKSGKGLAVSPSEDKPLRSLVINETGSADLYQIYSLLNECISLITGRIPLSYTIYYGTPGREYYRYSTDSLGEYVHYSASNKALRLRMSEFKQQMEKEKESTIEVTEHYGQFKQILFDCQTTHKVKKSRIRNNEGYLLEAFERHYQRNDGLAFTNEYSHWDLDEMWDQVSESLGSKPWFAGGDVGQTQVKSILRGNVRLTTLASLETVYSLLSATLVSMSQEQDLDRQVYKIMKTLYAKEDLGLQNYSKELDESIARFIDKAIKNLTQK